MQKYLVFNGHSWGPRNHAESKKTPKKILKRYKLEFLNSATNKLISSSVLDDTVRERERLNE